MKCGYTCVWAARVAASAATHSGSRSVHWTAQEPSTHVDVFCMICSTMVAESLTTGVVKTQVVVPDAGS